MTKSPTSTSPDLSEIDVHELLGQRRQIAAIWGVEDVQGVRADLTDDQAWEVLQRCRDLHDCEWGFNWRTIEIVADDMFPPTDELGDKP